MRYLVTIRREYAKSDVVYADSKKEAEATVEKMFDPKSYDKVMHDAGWELVGLSTEVKD